MTNIEEKLIKQAQSDDMDAFCLLAKQYERRIYLLVPPSATTGTPEPGQPNFRHSDFGPDYRSRFHAQQLQFTAGVGFRF